MPETHCNQNTKEIGFSAHKMEFGKANFQSEIPANKPILKAGKIEAIWAKETNNKQTRKPNEATRKLWHVLRVKWFKNLRR